MNADESQTPELIDESSEQIPSSIEPVDSTGAEELLPAEIAETIVVLELSLNETLPEEPQSYSQEQLEDSAVEFLSDMKQEYLDTEEASETEADVAEKLQQRIVELQRTEQALQQEIATLQTSYKQLSAQLTDTQMTMGRVVQEALVQLEQRKQSLQIAVEQLERRQERIRNEMKTTFAGASQDLAIRVQGFKDYLTGSLQDLALAAELLELVPKPKEEPIKQPVKQVQAETSSSTPQFAEQKFQSANKQIRRLLDQYRSKPDYYGQPWQLRRTFEPIHAERVSDWFLNQGGRGALRSMGSRLQNVLIASATISVLHSLYSDRLRTLILANTPERLGEWRRGLQDCLGISRADFGPERGVVLFESAEAVAVKAERLVKARQMPLIVIDDSEDKISLSLLQFPLWLAFAPDPKTARDYDY